MVGLMFILECAGKRSGDGAFYSSVEICYPKRCRAYAGHRAPQLTAAVSRVAIRADQERHMIVLRRVIDFEDHCNLRIKILDAEFREIVFGIEDQAVGAARKRLFNQKEGFHASVFISPG